MKTIARQQFLPPQSTAIRLGTAGFVAGPIVDSLHNQCLLQYNIAPITLSYSSDQTALFCSSWVVPPLLAFAYIVLGYILPRIIEFLPIPRESFDYNNDNSNVLRKRALLAVSSTELIIKLSEFLQTHESIQIGNNLFHSDAGSNSLLMGAADLCQWMILDRTPVALVAALVTAFGGPLSELPFVASGFWTYLPEAADYTPLAMIQPGAATEGIMSTLLGDDFRDIALSSITSGCYFAVTLDAIALGRYFYSLEVTESNRE